MKLICKPLDSGDGRMDGVVLADRPPFRLHLLDGRQGVRACRSFHFSWSTMVKLLAVTKHACWARFSLRHVSQQVQRVDRLSSDSAADREPPATHEVQDAISVVNI
jgi:hypothetical protein